MKTFAFLLFSTLLLTELSLEAITHLRTITPSAAGPTQYVSCHGCPYLYGLKRPPSPKSRQPGIRRILLLGDSVAAGEGVAREQTFASLLQTKLASTEIINTAVNGYNAYTELQYYRTVGREFHADLVMVTVCLNDIVDPRLHWHYTDDSLGPIPDDAFPNLEYDRNRKRSEWYRQLALYQYLTQIFHRPTYLTTEDDLGIQTWLAYDSPEWRWLRKQYDQLKQAVEGDGARLLLVIAPLAYQLDENYPYYPQKNLERYCHDAHLNCFDLLSSLRSHAKEGMFRENHARDYLDIWHFTPRGHAVVAEALEPWLRSY